MRTLLLQQQERNRNSKSRAHLLSKTPLLRSASEGMLQRQLGSVRNGPRKAGPNGPPATSELGMLTMFVLRATISQLVNHKNKKLPSLPRPPSGTFNTTPDPTKQMGLVSNHIIGIFNHDDRDFGPGCIRASLGYDTKANRFLGHDLLFLWHFNRQPARVLRAELVTRFRRFADAFG